MELLVFVSSHCPHCPKAVAIVKRIVSQYSDYDLRYKKIRAKTTEAKNLSPMYNIRVYPTVIFLNDDKEVLYTIDGVPGEKHLKDKIERLLGLKKSFWSKIFGG